MLIYHRTNLFESNAQTVVNTVNCVGVMGKGIAAEFKLRYPDMFQSYKRICDNGKLEPGKLWLWQASDRWVLNFPTKMHWRQPSRLEWIEMGLRKFVHAYEARGITSASFPRLGCGNGNLDWDDVRPLMESYLGKLSIPIYLHDFSVDVGLPEHLEALKAELDNEIEYVGAHRGFLDVFDRVLDRTEDRLTDFENSEPFSAKIVDNNLVLSVHGKSVVVEQDDLRGIWHALSKGPVTFTNATWAAGEGSGQLMSILSLAPGVRPVQIQRQDQVPETALELRSSIVSEVARLH